MIRRRTFSVATFLVHVDDVLLIHHKRLGLWLPVGGEMEKIGNTQTGEWAHYETPLEAAKREAKEETGLVPEFFTSTYALDGEPPGFLGYEEHDAGAKGTHLNFNFVGLVSSREVKSDGSFDGVLWHPIYQPFDGNPCDWGTTESVRQCLRRIAIMRAKGHLPRRTS